MIGDLKFLKQHEADISEKGDLPEASQRKANSAFLLYSFGNKEMEEYIREHSDIGFEPAV